jgi:hypothetical protein
MSSIKALKLTKKSLAQQREMIGELQALAESIERGEKMITELKAELEEVTRRHESRSTTQEDIAYLTDLLACAKKKLVWEKKMATLQKRTPELLETMAALMQDTVNPPTEPMREAIVLALQQVQAAMQRLEQAKVV